MSLTVLNFNRIRDLVSNLGWKEEPNNYVLGPDCLSMLENLENELLNEDVVNRNVRISLFICETIQNDLIPIVMYGKDPKVLATATRLLVSLSLPVEYLLPAEDSHLTPKCQNTWKQLNYSSLRIKKVFLDVPVTLTIVTMLRETMIKSVRHLVPLKEEDCNHLKNCLILLRNLLYIPENFEALGKNSEAISDWQSVQSKLTWNLFVQGLDGALLLMLNSKYRANWTLPLTHIIGLLYRGQNIAKIHQSLELISSASESTEDDEESDGSKISTTSLSSEPSKYANGLSDSGCPITSDSSSPSFKRNNCTMDLDWNYLNSECCSSDIHSQLEKVQISDDYPRTDWSENQANLRNVGESIILCNPAEQHFAHRESDSESSSGFKSPYHKKMKRNSSPPDNFIKAAFRRKLQHDSALGESIDHSSLDMVQSEYSKDFFYDRQAVKSHKAILKLQSLSSVKFLNENHFESNSSNEDMQTIKTKYRSHPPTGRRGKNHRQIKGCTPLVCMAAAYAASSCKDKVKYPLWEKRNSVSTLVDASSLTPSDEDIGNLINKFTLSFMHSGYSQLALDLKNLLLKGTSVTNDKALLFWVLSYFLHLAGKLNLSLNHISDLLSIDMISFLVYQCVLACENMEFISKGIERKQECKIYDLDLPVSALKEIICTVDLYSQKASSQKDKTFFTELCGKISELQDLRNIPLLLFQNSPNVNAKHFLENVAVLNHHILTIVEKGSDHCWEPKKMNMLVHLKQFSTRSIVICYGKLLENFKSNSNFLNECVFTMMHHLAGDVHSSQLLLEPSILKTFSSFLKEDVNLEQYQEDLVMYILNKFSVQVKKESLRAKKAEKSNCSSSSDDTSSDSGSITSCLLPEEDDLFWWYLQFEQDKDPITRISEHISTSKRDILSKLQQKGIISQERYKQLQMTMETVKMETHPSDDLTLMTNFDDDLSSLLNNLVQSGKRQHIVWLQDILLETCHARLGLDTPVAEPVPFYSVKMMTSVPIVPYAEEQKVILKDELFVMLLRKLGLYGVSCIGQVYPRIPVDWNSDVLFTVAARLGPIRKDQLKFSYELLVTYPDRDSVAAKSIHCPALRPMSSCYTLSSWLTAVQQSKENYRASKINEVVFEPAESLIKSSSCVSHFCI